MISRIIGIYCLIFLCSVNLCCGYKILVVFSFPGKSHAILGNAYVDQLLRDGHEVTYITAMPKNNAHENLTIVDVSELIALQPQFSIDSEGFSAQFLNIENIVNKEVDLKDKSLVLQLMFSFVNGTILHEKVQALIHDTSLQFDAVIVEWLYNELASGLAGVFNCPLIWSSSMDLHWSVMRLIDETPSPAYGNDIVIESVPPFTFLERVEQLWMRLTTTLAYELHIRHMDEEAYNKAFTAVAEKRGVKLPPYEEMKFKGSLMLGNSHPSTGGSLSTPQNYQHIGGYHIDSVVPPLPDNLQKVLDNAKEGFIYFSMGTMLQAKLMPTKMKSDIINIFKNSKYTVVWKFEEELPNTPPNVHIVKWAPQQSLLAHPNIKLFITHGGLLSMTETVHFGVPIICIPGFGDQHLNANRAAKKGFGIRVDLTADIADHLKIAIDEILTNPKYKESAKLYSALYHDRIMPPRQVLSFWVNHIIKYSHIQHLASPALMVPWYQKIFLDLALLILAVIFIVYKIITIVFARLLPKGDKVKVN